MGSRTPRDKLFKQVADERPEVFRAFLNIVLRHRPYRIPQGYTSWAKMAEVIAVALSTHVLKAHDNYAGLLSAARTALWFVKDAPVYCVKPELIDELWGGTIEDNPRILEDLNTEDCTILFLLPDGSLQSPSGHKLDHIVFHISDQKRPDSSQGKAFGVEVEYLPHPFPIHYSWATADTYGMCWLGAWGVKDGKITTTAEDLGSLAPAPAEREWLNKMRSLVLQFLLVMKYEPELIDASTSTTSARRRENNSSNRSLQRRPRILGTEKPKRKLYPRRGGSHASPEPHWRLLDPDRNPRWKYRRWVRVLPQTDD